MSRAPLRFLFACLLWTLWAAEAGGASPRTPPPTWIVEGTVLAASGLPAPGAAVDLLANDARQSAASGADGRFRFRVVRSGKYLLFARSGGEAGLAAVTLDREGPAPASFEVRLWPGGSLSAAVKTASGAPLEGASVSVAVNHSTLLTATTDASGRASLGPLPAARVEVLVSAKGFAVPARRWVVVLAGETASEELTLSPAAALSGTVVDGKGAPVRGARIQASGEQRRVPEGLFDVLFGGERERASAVSDAKGRFRIEGLTEGARYEVTAEAQGLDVHRSEVTLPAEPLRVVLRKLEDLRGVVKRQGGGFCEHCLVIASPADEKQGGRPYKCTAFTDGRGAFRYGGMSPRAYWLVASDSDGSCVGALRAELGPGLAPIRFTCAKGERLAGTVRDPDGAPLVAAEVTASHETREPPKMNGPLRTRTDEQGRFEFPGLLPGPYRVKVRLAGWEQDERQGIEAAAGGPELDLALRRAGRAAGRVLDTAGKPIASYLVNGQLVRHAEGRFEVDAQRGEPLLLRFEAPGLAPAVRAASPKPGAVEEVPDVVLGPGRSLAGTVVDPEGKPVPGASVAFGLPVSRSAWPNPFVEQGEVVQALLALASPFMNRSDGAPPSGASVASMTGPDGAFLLTDVEAGPGQLLVEHPGFADVRVERPAEGLAVKLERGAAIAVRVISASGGPAARRAIFAVGDHLLRRCTTGLDGSCRVEGLRPGKYWILALDEPRFPPRQQAEPWRRQLVEAGAEPASVTFQEPADEQPGR